LLFWKDKIYEDHPSRRCEIHVAPGSMLNLASRERRPCLEQGPAIRVLVMPFVLTFSMSRWL
jgi:hypothetical protein